jgi:REP element-mobilizing transposase RayT
MGKTTGYMVTWTTYGTWLQGDERGFVKNGQVLDGWERLRKANERKRKGNVVKLNKGERAIVRKAIEAEAKRIGERILALSVWSNHVHVVIGAGGGPVSRVVSRLKCTGYYALRERGINGRVWTRGYDKRFCFDEKSLCDRIAYVKSQRD